MIHAADIVKVVFHNNAVRARLPGRPAPILVHKRIFPQLSIRRLVIEYRFFVVKPFRIFSMLRVGILDSYIDIVSLFRS